MTLSIQVQPPTAGGRSAASAGLPAHTSVCHRRRLVATVLASPFQSQSHRVDVDGEAGS